MANTVLDAGMLGTQVLAITGDGNAAAVASAYGGWLSSIIGSMPEVMPDPSAKGRALIVLTTEQVSAMRKWLDLQVKGALQAPGEPGVVDYGLGPVLGPWAIQRTAPILIAAVVSGWVAHWLLSK